MVTIQERIKELEEKRIYIRRQILELRKQAGEHEPTKAKVLRALQQCQPATHTQVAAIAGITPAKARNALVYLRQCNAVDRQITGQTTPALWRCV